MIAGIVLAAGRARRFGATKVLARLDASPLVRHVVDRLRLAEVTPVIVVGGEDAEATRSALEGTGALVVVNLTPDDGLSSSLRVGIDALPIACEAFVVALGDQPLIDADVVRTLVDVWRGSNAAAVVPMYRDGRGNPVLFDGTARRLLQTLTGDVGARDVLERLGERVVRVDVDAEAPRDVDTRDDLQALSR